MNDKIRELLKELEAVAESRESTPKERIRAHRAAKLIKELYAN